MFLHGFRLWLLISIWAVVEPHAFVERENLHGISGNCYDDGQRSETFNSIRKTLIRAGHACDLRVRVCARTSSCLLPIAGFEPKSC